MVDEPSEIPGRLNGVWFSSTSRVYEMEEDRYATIPDRDSNDPTDRAFSNPSSMMLGNQ